MRKNRSILCAVEWLNYHHLLYFWSVVRTGSVAAASVELRLAPPTISVQIRRLEEQLGEKLLRRSGRRVLPTEMGQAVFRYAEAGLWYDAIATISEMIEKTPDDRKLRKQRASLLQQVGLWEVARYDNPE